MSMPRTYRTIDDTVEPNVYGRKYMYLDHSESDLRLHHLAGVGAVLTIFMMTVLIVGVMVS